MASLLDMVEYRDSDPLVGFVEGSEEQWLLDWLTANQLPKFNGKGVLRTVREIGLSAWLSGFAPNMLAPARERALREREAMKEQGVIPLVLGRQGYPHLLAQLPDAPWVLFAKGNPKVLSGRRPLGIVGTRRASTVGYGAVETLFDGMPDSGWVMVSGMADGIDARAHGLAARRGIPTVACLAHGLHGVHPKTNVRLAHHILDSGGCWVSEYRWGTPPTKYTFPARNRIIAGLVEAVVVVESGDPGGSLITARLARDYDREVFALSPTWCADAMKGNARLIREQVAELLHAPEDLPRALGWVQSEKKALDPWTVDRSEEGATAWLEALDPYRSCPFDEVVERLNGEPHAVRKRLLEAELKGWVRCWPGDRFTRTVR